MSMQVSYKKQILFFLILLIVFLFIIEGLIRIIDLVNVKCNFAKNELFDKFNLFEKEILCTEYTDIMYDYSPPIRLLIPNQVGQYLNINSDGFRGQEVNFSTNSYRIFMLGGSTLFGIVSSNDEFTIPALLEKKLNDKGLDVIVINAGIPASYSREEAYYLEKYLIKYSPNMIIMYDGENDGSQKIDYFSDDEWEKNDFYINHGYAPIIQGTKILKFFEKIDYRTGIGLIQFVKSIDLHDAGKNHKNSQNNDLNFSYQFDDKRLRLEKYWSKACRLGEIHGFTTVNVIQPVLRTGERELSLSEKLIPQGIGSMFLNNLKLNQTNIQTCENIIDARNTFDGVNKETIFFDGAHMSDFGNEIMANKIAESVFPIISKEVHKK